LPRLDLVDVVASPPSQVQEKKPPIGVSSKPASRAILIVWRTDWAKFRPP
jgi:hypothetical protein